MRRGRNGSIEAILFIVTPMSSHPAFPAALSARTQSDLSKSLRPILQYCHLRHGGSPFDSPAASPAQEAHVPKRSAITGTTLSPVEQTTADWLGSKRVRGRGGARRTPNARGSALDKCSILSSSRYPSALAAPPCRRADRVIEPIGDGAAIGVAPLHQGHCKRHRYV
jgi:hypothetical protein